MIRLLTLKDSLPIAQSGQYGIGAFSPRNTVLIRAVMEAAQICRSPVIVQISANELRWFECTPQVFAEAFYACARDYSVPVVLHLDHTRDPAIIHDAIDAGFTSVMIDASHLDFDQNVSMTRSVVAYAHERGVSVEAELGRILATDKLETEQDSLLYTIPAEAAAFVSLTGIDALAVSIGTAHGVYPVKDPRLDLARLAEIRRATSIPLVLHGASGLPAATVQQAIRMNEGGVSKINIATDLELEFQRVMKVSRMSNTAVAQLDPARLAVAADAVRDLVVLRMTDFLGSTGHAGDFADLQTRPVRTGRLTPL